MLPRPFAALLALILVLPLSAHADAVTDQTLLVNKAATTVERLRRDSNLQHDLEGKLARARAVLIVPDLVKGGFILGAEWGTGVLLTRDAAGQWSGPAFYSVASGSVGLQIGIQDAESIFVIMSDAGLRAVMENRFKAGADAGIAVAHVGAGAEAATTTNAAPISMPSTRRSAPMAAPRWKGRASCPAIRGTPPITAATRRRGHHRRPPARPSTKPAG